MNSNIIRDAMDEIELLWKPGYVTYRSEYEQGLSGPIGAIIEAMLTVPKTQLLRQLSAGRNEHWSARTYDDDDLQEIIVTLTDMPGSLTSTGDTDFKVRLHILLSVHDRSWFEIAFKGHVHQDSVFAALDKIALQAKLSAAS